MKKLFLTIAIALTGLALSAPDAQAQGRSGRGTPHAAASRHRAPAASSARPAGGGHSSTTRPSGGGHSSASRPAINTGSQASKNEAVRGPRPGIATQRPSATVTRPGSSRPDGGNRPNGGGHSGHNRPGGINGGNHGGGNHGGGNHGGSQHRPGGNHGGNHGGSAADRPGHGNHRPGGNQPTWGGGNYRPGHNHPGHNRPGGFRPGHHTPAPPPMRPMRPAYRPWAAPPPPPRAWRPGPRGPRFNAVFGISFGTTLAASINLLSGSNYIVDGYLDDAIYLRNVNELGYLWPDATMYYSNAGALIGSQLYFSLPYYSTDRYTSVHATLSRLYGAPAVTSQGTAVWYGPSGDYISLSFGGQLNSAGQTAYVTTLTFGR